jgi:D-sedoheptulose 7-phosphate isomerase
MTRPLIEAFLRDLSDAAARTPADVLDRAVDILAGTWRSGGTIFTMGNGGSASTAQHFACDLAKVASVPGKPRVRALSLVDNVPLVSALTNDEGWASLYVEQMENLFRPGDCAVAFSVHGGSGSDKAGPWSQNLVRALRFARERGGKAIGIAGFDGGAFPEVCDVAVVVPAATTPLVESLHLGVEHVLTIALRERIAAA